MAQHFLRLQMGGKTSRCGGYVQIYLISRSGQLTRTGLQPEGFSGGLRTPHCEKPACYKLLLRALYLVVSCEHISTFRFHERWGNSWLVDYTIVSQEACCCMELVSK
jgi:hypothetical protein